MRRDLCSQKDMARLPNRTGLNPVSFFPRSIFCRNRTRSLLEASLATSDFPISPFVLPPPPTPPSLHIHS